MFMKHDSLKSKKMVCGRYLGKIVVSLKAWIEKFCSYCCQVMMK